MTTVTHPLLTDCFKLRCSLCPSPALDEKENGSLGSPTGSSACEIAAAVVGSHPTPSLTDDAFGRQKSMIIWQTAPQCRRMRYNVGCSDMGSVSDDPVAWWHDAHPCRLAPSRTVRARHAQLLREHLLDLFVAQVDLVHRVAALLEWHILVVTERRHEDLGIPDKALAGSEVGDLGTPCKQWLCGLLAQHSVMPLLGEKLTSRMGPSGSSPILMVVHSCSVNAEPSQVELGVSCGAQTVALIETN